MSCFEMTNIGLLGYYKRSDELEYLVPAQTEILRRMDGGVGLSALDELAEKVMLVMLPVTTDLPVVEGLAPCEVAASLAYNMADAMIAERARRVIDPEREGASE